MKPFGSAKQPHSEGQKENDFKIAHAVSQALPANGQARDVHLLDPVRDYTLTAFELQNNSFFGKLDGRIG